jgi:hypothetical protein
MHLYACPYRKNRQATAHGDNFDMEHNHNINSILVVFHQLGEYGEIACG